MPAIDFNKAQAAWSLRWEDDWVSAVAFVGNSRRLVAGNQLGALLVWDLPEKPGTQELLPVRRLDGHTNVITKLLPLPDGRRVVSASCDHTLRVWDLDAPSTGKGKVIIDAETRDRNAKKNSKPRPEIPPVEVGAQSAERVIEAHKEWIQAMVLSADGKLLVTGDDEGVVIVWDTSTWKEVRRAQAKGWIQSLAITQDGKRLFVGERVPLVFDSGRHAGVRIWDMETLTPKTDLSKMFAKEHMGAAAFSPDGKQLALGIGGEGSGKIHIVDGDGTKKVRELAGHQSGVTEMLYTPDGKHLLSAGRDTLVKVWQASDGKMVKEIGKPRGGQFKDQILGISPSPDWSRLATADQSGLVQVWTLT